MTSPTLPDAYRDCRAYVADVLHPRLCALAAPGPVDLLAPAGERLRPAQTWVAAREFSAILESADAVTDPPAATSLTAVHGLSRAAFEAALDLHLLVQPLSLEPVRQALGFDVILLHQAEEKWLDFRASGRGQGSASNAGGAEPEPAAVDRARAEEIVRNIWGFTRKGTPRFPEHWSGLRVSQRLEALATSAPAIAAVLEGLYRESYLCAARARCARHSGTAPAEARARVVAWHRCMVFELLLRATAAIAPLLGGEPIPSTASGWWPKLQQRPQARVLEFDVADRA